MSKVILIELSRLNRVNAEKRTQLLAKIKEYQNDPMNSLIFESIKKLTVEVKQIDRIQRNLWHIYGQIISKCKKLQTSTNQNLMIKHQIN